jgi:hypothetical protein
VKIIGDGESSDFGGFDWVLAQMQPRWRFSFSLRLISPSLAVISFSFTQHLFTHHRQSR